MSAYTKYPGLAERVAYVTGGGSGIGADIVRALCENGAKVVFCDIDAKASGALVDEIASKNMPAPHFHNLDLRDIPALQHSISQAVSENGPIRVLVNNAARDDRHDIATVTPEMFDENIAVNFRHQVFAAQAVRESMAAAGGGSIINMSSITALLGHEELPVYASAKAAVLGLTRTLARVYGPENIRVNAVVPGWVLTERQIQKWLTPEGKIKLLQDQCLKKTIEGRDVANLVLFLASEDSSMITRQSFVIDAGWT